MEKEASFDKKTSALEAAVTKHMVKYGKMSDFQRAHGKVHSCSVLCSSVLVFVCMPVCTLDM